MTVLTVCRELRRLGTQSGSLTAQGSLWSHLEEGYCPGGGNSKTAKETAKAF